MKRLLLITCCLFFGNSFFTQDYIPFPDSVATWNSYQYEHSPFDIVGEQIINRGYNVHVEGDTLVNDTLYSKLYVRDSWGQYQLTGPSPIFEETNYSQEDNPYILAGGIREGESKKVWYRNLNFDNWENSFPPYPWYRSILYSDILANQLIENTEVMLYDFGLSVGDSVYFHDGNCSSAWATLEDISINILGRKNFVFISDDWNDPVVWIEGIGDITSGPFSRFDIAVCQGLGFDVGKDLVCFWGNGEQIYSNVNFNVQGDCEAIVLVGVNEFKKSSLDIYPNPSTGRFVIELPALRQAQEPIAFQVFNSLGDEVYGESDVFGELSEIDISAFPAGIYMVHLTIGGYGIETSTSSRTYSAIIVKE